MDREMKKQVFKWSVFPLVIIILVGAYPTYRVISKTSTDYQVTQELKNNGFYEEVDSKEVLFQSKTGRYVVEIKFKDEPQHTYNYEVIGGDILTIIYDSNNGSVTPGENTKYYLK